MTLHWIKRLWTSKCCYFQICFISYSTTEFPLLVVSFFQWLFLLRETEQTITIRQAVARQPWWKAGKCTGFVVGCGECKQCQVSILCNMDEKNSGFPPETYSTSYNLRNEIKHVSFIYSHECQIYFNELVKVRCHSNNCFISHNLKNK